MPKTDVEYRKGTGNEQNLRLQPNNTAEVLFAMNSDKISLRDARIIANTVPERGTPEWDEREMLRQRIGCHCISTSRLGSRKRWF